MGESLRISGRTKMVCLIGSPVTHSLSPAMHNLSFETLGLDVVYLAFDVNPGALQHIVEAFKYMDGMVGCNVTMPCKRYIVPYLDELSPAAHLMANANVVKFEDGWAVGHNTDGMGFVTNLRKHDVPVEGATMTLVGPGGAGSALLVQSALDGMKKINVFARVGGDSHHAAERLVPRVMREVDCDITIHDMEDLDDLRACIADSDILTNATNVGMGESSHKSPVPADFIAPGVVVADAIYFPRKTQLLLDAEERGNKTISGLGMLIEQAAAGEKIWFDVDMPVDLIEEKFF